MWVDVLLGWAIAEEGRTVEGIAQIRRSLHAQQKVGSRIARTYFLALLADTLLRSDQTDDARAVIAEALPDVEETDERFFEPELHRIHGELLMRRDQGDEALRAFGKSLKAAVASGANALYSRTAASLNGLPTKYRKEAKDLLLNFGPPEHSN